MSGCAVSAGEETRGYVVRPQDTLYSIAWRHDLDYRDLARWNHIGPDFRISVGQILVLGPGRVSAAAASVPGQAASPPVPATGTRAAGAAPSQRTRTPAGGNAAAGNAAGGNAAGGNAAGGNAAAGNATGGGAAGATAGSSAAGGTRVGASAGGVAGRRAAGGAAPNGAAEPLARGGAQQKWVWPTNRTAGLTASGGGILLPGILGQEVRAAGGGRVVYTGSGLRGYGNLIIIKHADSLLSAYAHNREVMVHEGQDVAVGQVIARMGEGAHQQASLYFEIRLNGKPVDPLPFMPATK